MHAVPDALRHGPVARAEALASGLPRKVIEGPQFRRLHEAVYVHRDHPMTQDDRIRAALLACPSGTCATGVTRLHQLGLDVADAEQPVHLVLAGDHHLALDGVFLHRTARMPPHGDEGVTAAAAFVEYCRTATVVDGVAVGDWLLHRGHMTCGELDLLCAEEPWRAGAREALWVRPLLDGDARSLPESRVRIVLGAAGLPAPEVNQPLDPEADVLVIPDLHYRRWRTAVEYEGSHHQEDREQYVADIDRYSLLRDEAVRYVQVTKELMRTPRMVVGRVFRALLAEGYDGPPPAVGEDWRTIFLSIHQALGRSRERDAA